MTTKHTKVSTCSTEIEKLLDSAGLVTTTTKAGWCLREGLDHLCRVDGGHSACLIEQYGLPSLYECVISQSCHCRHEQISKKPRSCFQSLCRIIVGQFVSGHSAQAVWKRLLQHTQNNLTPQTILQLTDIEEQLQKPIGTTRRKAESIVDLAKQFDQDGLSEDFLTQSDESTIRQALLKVKGIGPWSCDMYLMFYLERPNVLPLGDLGVRKGLVKHFGFQSLCPKKDADKVRERLQIYEPYQSLLAYYMWRVADIPVINEAVTEKKSDQTTESPKKRKRVPRMITP